MLFFRLSLLTLVLILDVGTGLNVCQAYDQAATKTAFQNKQFEEVIKLLSPEVEKLDHEGLLLLARAYSATQKTEAAIKVYNAVLSKNPKDFEAKAELGAEQFSQGKDSIAIATEREALEINDKWMPAYKTLIQIYEKKKNKYELRILYEDMLQKKLQAPDHMAKLCELTTLDRLYDLAMKYCQAGVEKDPENPASYIYLGLTYRDTEEPKKAEMYLRRAAIRFPRSLLAQITYAQHLDDKKSYIESYNYYRRSTEADAKSADAFIGLGKSALEIQKYKESLEAFKKACALSKSSLPAIRRATNTLRTMKMSEWLKPFEKASDQCGFKTVETE